MPTYLNNNNEIGVTHAIMKSWKKRSTKKARDNTKQVYQKNIKEATMTVKRHSFSST